MPINAMNGCPFYAFKPIPGKDLNRLPLVELWASIGFAFEPAPISEGRKKPVAGLQRHPLIYPIFPCNQSPTELALSSRRGTSTSSPFSKVLKGSAAISPLFTFQVLLKIMAQYYRVFYILSRGKIEKF